MRESAAIARIRIFRRAGYELHLPGSGHQKDIAEIRMSRSAEMGMAEADDGLVLPTIAGAVLIGLFLIYSVDIMRDIVCVRAELHSAERHAGTGEGMTHSVGSYHRVNIRRGALRRCRKA